MASERKWNFDTSGQSENRSSNPLAGRHVTWTIVMTTIRSGLVRSKKREIKNKLKHHVKTLRSERPFIGGLKWKMLKEKESYIQFS